MKKVKIIGSLLCASLLFNTVCYAATPDLNIDSVNSEDFVLDNGHGEYKIDVNKISTQNLNSTSKKVKVKKINRMYMK